MGYFFYGGWGMLLFWGALIVVVLLLVRIASKERKSNESDTKMPRRQTALEILQMRYAKGEINAEEYERMKSIVEGTGET